MATPIKNVAIIGAGGRIGKAITTALLATGKHTITALTRADSTSKIPPGVSVQSIDYSDPSTIISALRSQQFLIITLGVRVPEETHTMIVKAAAEAGISYIMPNIYGFDPQGPDVDDPLFGAAAMRRIKEVEETGIPWIIVTTGFWYEWSLALGDNWYGIDIAARKAWFCDDGNTPINTSTWARCGEAVAALLGLPESGIELCLRDFANRPCYVDSFAVTQRGILDSVQRVTGTGDKDWEIVCEPAEKRYEDGLREMKTDPRGFAKALYAKGWMKNGGRNYGDKLDNERLGLKSEDLDLVTKEVVEKVQNGWNPWVEW